MGDMLGTSPAMKELFEAVKRPPTRQHPMARTFDLSNRRNHIALVRLTALLPRDLLETGMRVFPTEEPHQVGMIL